MPSNCLPSRDEAFSFHSGVLPDRSRKPSPSLGVAEDAQELMGKVYMR
ncbi:MAG: hypothetical protein WBW70_08180 [Candidatus Sulfotelmatobacter sp.]